MRKGHKLLVIALIFIYVSDTYAQFLNGPDALLFGGNNVTLGFDKYSTTINFLGNIELLEISNYGGFYLKQNYNGISITSANSFRDDQSMLFGYYYPLDSSISLVSEMNWQLNADTRSIGLNELQRLNAIAGLRYFANDNFSISAAAGPEQNTQIGIVSSGILFKGNAVLSNSEIDGYMFSGKALSEYLNLDDGKRQNSDFQFNINAFKNYGSYDDIELDMNYKYLSRDFINSSFTPIEDYIIENRTESRVGTDMAVTYGISDRLVTRMELGIRSLDVTRSYKEYLIDEDLTGVSKNLKELQIDVAFNVKYSSDDIFQDLTFKINSRDEDNYIENKYDINDTELNRLQNLENRRDNITMRNSIVSGTKWRINRYNSLDLDYNISLLRYDTPSPDNNDDRDEFSSILKLTYAKQFSNHLTLDLIGEYHLNHLVFIKSARSALNNKNRILKFSPVVHINYKKFAMEPSIEVLANYTVYDFEDINPNVRSFSFRQISYKDSLRVNITNKLKLKTRLLYRYFERGILYWDSFKETPQSSNRELLTDLLLLDQVDEVFQIGLGIKYYNLNQQNLGVNSSLIMNQESIGPQIAISAYFLSGSMLNITGWYEFRKSHGGVQREIPNIYLNTSVKF